MKLLSFLVIMSTGLCLAMKSGNQLTNTRVIRTENPPIYITPVDALKSMMKNDPTKQIRSLLKRETPELPIKSKIVFKSDKEKELVIESIIKHRKLADKNYNAFPLISDKKKGYEVKSFFNSTSLDESKLAREIVVQYRAKELRERLLLDFFSPLLPLKSGRILDIVRGRFIIYKDNREVISNNSEHPNIVEARNYAVKAYGYWLEVFGTAYTQKEDFQKLSKLRKSENLVFEAKFSKGAENLVNRSILVGYMFAAGFGLNFPFLSLSRAQEIIDSKLYNKLVSKNTAGPLSVEEGFLYAMSRLDKEEINVRTCLIIWLYQIIKNEVSREEMDDVLMLMQHPLKEAFNGFFKLSINKEFTSTFTLDLQPSLEEIIKAQEPGCFIKVDEKMGRVIEEAFKIFVAPGSQIGKLSIRPYLFGAGINYKPWHHIALRASAKDLVANIKSAKAEVKKLTEKLKDMEKLTKNLTSLLPIIREYMEKQNLEKWGQDSGVELIMKCIAKYLMDKAKRAKTQAERLTEKLDKVTRAIEKVPRPVVAIILAYLRAPDYLKFKKALNIKL